jgi:hypothetical protein
METAIRDVPEDVETLYRPDFTLIARRTCAQPIPWRCQGDRPSEVQPKTSRVCVGEVVKSFARKTVAAAFAIKCIFRQTPEQRE